jgi:hypothetical protein
MKQASEIVLVLSALFLPFIFLLFRHHEASYSDYINPIILLVKIIRKPKIRVDG